MSEWYISRDGNKYGPYTMQELRTFARQGRVQPDDKVWKEGLVAPIKARQIKGLFESPTTSDDELDDLINDASVSSPPRPAGSRHASFVAAVRSTIATGFSSFYELLAHPIQYAFGTVVLIIACFLSIPGLVTIILIPVFVLGYIPYMQSILKREPASLGKFISFMRHGWDSLWHLLMLLGTFFVATAIAVAPFVIAAVLVYVTMGTISLGGMQVIHLSPAEPSKPDVRKNERADRSNPAPMPAPGPARGKEAGPDAVNGFFTHLMAAIDSLGDAASWVIGLVITGLFLTAFLTPSGAVMILIYCIILMVATAEASKEAKYDLVYDAFERMLLIARLQWKRLVSSGIWLVSLPVTLYIVTEFAVATLSAIRLPYFALWIPSVLLPTAGFAFVVYANIFAVQTAMQLVASQDSN